MPKRRKDKYNPYTLEFNEDKNTYTIEFIDSKNAIHILEISTKLYQAFNKFELEDISQMHKYERHIEHLEISEETLYKKVVHSKESIEEEIIRKSTFEDLKNAIEELPK